MMIDRRDAIRLLGPSCAVMLLLICFRSVLFEGRQFGYRDAGHFYYPLYRVVQREWQAGRWPLWNPWHNGGTPLLGMPMAAVLYPGKFVFALFPYPLAFRLYVVAHTIIAWLGMLLFLRRLGVSLTGAFVGAMSYAFGAPVLFLHSNVIFLVGAAWAAWGFLAVHRLMSERKRQALVELALVLALQILGGDPEAAYLTLIFGSIYAGVLAFQQTGRKDRLPNRRRALAGRMLAVGFAWFTLVCGVAYAGRPGVTKNWLPQGHITWISVFLAVSLIGLWGVRRSALLQRIWQLSAGLAGAGLLGAALTAVQLGPTWEFAARSNRLSNASATGQYDFSVEPYRLIEAIWPHIYGLEVPVNRSWIHGLAPPGEPMIWSPSLYVGAFTLVLFLGAVALRAEEPQRTWLTIVAMLSLIAAMGKFAGPLWWMRWVPQLANLVGGHDPHASISRTDEFLSDGAGSVYGLLATVLPGFSLFRYPAKLVVFACLAISALAGVGWDRLAAGESRLIRRWCSWGASASVVLLALVLGTRPTMEAWISRRVSPSPLFGPIDHSGAVNETLWALVRGGALYTVGWVLTPWACRRSQAAGALALVALTGDLGLADCRIVWTVPQASLDTAPLAAQLIKEAERRSPSPGPYRIHRVERWHPADFLWRRSDERLDELVAWEHDTLDRLHGQPVPLAYTAIRGLIDLDEYLDFFEGRGTLGKDEQGINRPILSFRRGGFDLWNTRYFIMPVGLNGWMGEERGFTRIYPDDGIVADPEQSRRWIARQGWQLLRNRRALPRTWIVHDVVAIPPTAAGSPDRAELIQTLVDSIEPLAGGRGQRHQVDIMQTAFVETDEPAKVAELVVRAGTDRFESLRIVKAEPQSVELQVTLSRPGLVILADLYYPGWRLTIDGAPAHILRANRMMRGAAVPAGKHTLLYTYKPKSFTIGLVVSLASLIVLGVLYRWSARFF
jgi:hypothetical protein